MRDDKGNKVKKMTIVRDSDTQIHYLVIDKNNCIKVDKNAFLQTFDQLKAEGYIKTEVADIPRQS